MILSKQLHILVIVHIDDAVCGIFVLLLCVPVVYYRIGKAEESGVAAVDSGYTVCTNDPFNCVAPPWLAQSLPMSLNK